MILAPEHYAFFVVLVIILFVLLVFWIHMKMQIKKLEKGKKKDENNKS